MKQHLFLGSDGDLYDTRNPQWSKLAPLRAGYSRHSRDIGTVAQFKATLRAGKSTNLGGYPLFLLCSDGGTLCFDCARKNVRNIFESVAGRSNDGWRVVACDVNYEDSDMVCENCSKPIEPAYGD